jgi:hypothetical protein
MTLLLTPTSKFYLEVGVSMFGTIGIGAVLIEDRFLNTSS